MLLLINFPTSEAHATKGVVIAKGVAFWCSTIFWETNAPIVKTKVRNVEDLG